tara:strand:+ start:99 stop:500 length:402 start_codon:yes stop_codon:yes gene_type:complete
VDSKFNNENKMKNFKYYKATSTHPHGYHKFTEDGTLVSISKTDGFTALFRTKDTTEVSAGEYGVSKEVAKRRLENGRGSTPSLEFSKNGKLHKTVNLGMPLIKMLEVTEITEKEFYEGEKSFSSNYRYTEGGG